MALKHKGRWIALVVGILVLAGIGAIAAQRLGERKAQAAKKEAELKLPKVVALAPSDVFTLQSKVIAPLLHLSGTLEPIAQGVAKSRASGGLLGATKREGDSVRAGEVLGSVDAADLKMRLAQQEGLRAQAQAQFDTARKSRIAQQSLLDKGFISQNAFDATDGNYQAAKAALDSTAAQVNIAAQTIKDTTIISPIAGVISKRHVEPGERVTPEMTVYTILQVDTLEFAPQVPAEDAAKLRLGMKLAIEIPGVAAPISATISRIAPAASAGTRTVDVRAKLDNPERALKAGVSATGRVAIAEAIAAAVIPLDALRAADADPHVYLAIDNLAKRVPVTLGARDERSGTVVILSGAKVGDRVISGRVQDIKDGQAIRLLSDAAAPTTPAPTIPAAQKS